VSSYEEMPPPRADERDPGHAVAGPAPPYAPPPPAHPPGPVYPAQPAVVGSTNGFAIASLVLGIVWIYWVGSVLALIFGYIAVSQINASGGLQQGRGLAIAGIVLGWIGVGILVVVLLVGAAAATS
jgi:Domain of unknown function (DUF4190)